MRNEQYERHTGKKLFPKNWTKADFQMDRKDFKAKLKRKCSNKCVERRYEKFYKTQKIRTEKETKGREPDSLRVRT